MYMKLNEKSNPIVSKPQFKWLTLLTFFGILLIFTNCSKDDDNIEDDVESYPTLKIVNTVTDNRYITSVKMVNYEFNNLNITSGNSQSFTLDNGMPGGLENINITVSYRTSTTPSNSKSKAVNFEKGKTTALTLKGCISYEGCNGYTLE